jgi:hypothetical protein
MHLNTSLKIQVHESRCHTLAQIYEGMMKVQLYLDFFYFQMDRPLTCINVFFFHIIVIIYQSFHIKIIFIHYFDMKIPHILCVIYHKLNGMHHCFIMQVKEVLNRFLNVYAINMNVITCVTTFLAYFTMLSSKK